MNELAAALTIFFISDLVYTLDHYFVHHDRQRYGTTHAIHHRRYSRAKEAPHLTSYEVSTYASAAFMSCCGTSVLSLLTGNWGFFLGAVFKFGHSLVFHLYQHGWWSEVSVRKQSLGTPKRGWGIASARYHAFHHSHPEEGIFTFAESWKGFDRLLEWAHPRLYRFTVDGKKGLPMRVRRFSPGEPEGALANEALR